VKLDGDGWGWMEMKSLGMGVISDPVQVSNLYTQEGKKYLRN